MKRFMYLLVFSVYMVFMTASCGSGPQKSDDHGHEHGTENHYLDQEHEHTQQEEFVASDSASTPATDEHHDNDHVHNQAHGHEH